MPAVSTPLVSIGMPVYNCEKTLAQAIRSILLQTFQDWVLILIDDGSTDETIGIAQGFDDQRIRVLADGKHKGLPERLNEAIKESRGNYFARMDGDDIAYPRRLERQLAYMKEHPEVDLVGAGILLFGVKGVVVGKRVGGRLPVGRWGIAVRSVPVPHPTFFGKTEWFLQQGYATWPVHFQDQLLLIRAFEGSVIRILPEILLGYREETLDITKQARYRLSYLKSSRQLRQLLGLFLTAGLVSAQMLKLVLDACAISTGLKYHILRYRAMPVTSLEAAEWSQVWQTVNGLVSQEPRR